MFTLAIEPLAIALRNHPLISGISIGPNTYTLSLFVDDLVLYLSNPYFSLPHVDSEFYNFGICSGLSVNFSKSTNFLIHLTQSKIQRIDSIHSYSWTRSTWHYLGIDVPLDLSQLFQVNFSPLLTTVSNLLKQWKDLNLTWPNKLTLIKSFILPCFLYFFCALPINISLRDLHKWQLKLNNFIWSNKKPRVRFCLFISLYYIVVIVRTVKC